MPKAVEWLGLRAVYGDEELALMADLKAGVSAGEVGQRELEVIHELKHYLSAKVVDWMEPQSVPSEQPFADTANSAIEGTQNDEGPPKRYRRGGPVEGQGSFFATTA